MTSGPAYGAPAGSGPHPDPQPLEVNEVAVVVVGTVLWAVAFVVLLAGFYDDLRRNGTTWWLWTCGVGVLLGAYGIWFTRRRHPPGRRHPG